MIVVVLLALLIVACRQQNVPAPTPSAPSPVVPAPAPPPPIEGQNPVFDSRCPSNCNDNDACSQDICNKQTDFECRHVPITPCCGNGVCEDSETPNSCSKDCTGGSPEFKQLITNSGNANTFSYRYEYSENDVMKTSYTVWIYKNYTLIDFDDLQNKASFSYNWAFVNATAGTTTLYCLNNCGPTTKAKIMQGATEFAQRPPIETLQSLISANIVGTENVEGKSTSILVKKNDDGTTTRVNVWTFFGTPMVIETLDSNNNVLNRIRYKGISINTARESDAVPPRDLVYG